MSRILTARDLTVLGAGIGALAAVVLLLRQLGSISPTTVALLLLVVVLCTATAARLRVATTVSVVAMLAFNYFFLPPVGTLTIAEPQNWVALLVFLIVAVMGSNLSAAAQRRTREAIERRNEVTRLFDLTRDVLLTTETVGAIPSIARHVARRFELSGIAVFLPDDTGWRAYQGGADEIVVDPGVLNTALAKARATLEFDAQERAYGGHLQVGPGGETSLVPLRHGTRPIGLLAATTPRLDIGTLDAVAGVVAIAIERAQFLAERDAAELVRQKADLASTLLASLSHDLRTPLTAIGTAVENLRGDLPAAERAAQAGAAMAELERLTRLFRDILDMARIDAAAIRVDREWVAPGDVVDAAVAHVRHALDPHPLHVDSDDGREIQIDPRLASVALSHLLENAALYSSPGKNIRVDARTDGEGLRVSVLDEGPGLDPGELEHLFERFYRGRSARRTTFGTGMGLAITRGLLAAAGGRVWAENVPGAGARFSMTVPGPARILLVDDEPNIIGTVAPLLRSRGYEPLTAMSGRAALEVFDRDGPDLVVLDLGLPDMDGAEVCRHIRRTSGIPILVLSARGAEGDKVSALDAGADDYVTKPFGAEELLARIRAALRRVDSPSPPGEALVRGGLVIDRERFRVLRDGEELRLTPKEFELLALLAQHAGRVLTHRTILKAIWGANAVDQPEHLRVLVGSLRKKIEANPSAPKYILTEPWVGYRFAAE